MSFNDLIDNMSNKIYERLNNSEYNLINDISENILNGGTTLTAKEYLEEVKKVLNKTYEENFRNNKSKYEIFKNIALSKYYRDQILVCINKDLVNKEDKLKDLKNTLCSNNIYDFLIDLHSLPRNINNIENSYNGYIGLNTIYILIIFCIFVILILLIYKFIVNDLRLNLPSIGSIIIIIIIVLLILILIINKYTNLFLDLYKKPNNDEEKEDIKNIE